MCWMLLQQVPRAGKLCRPDGIRMPMPDGQVTKRSIYTSASEPVSYTGALVTVIQSYICDDSM